MGRIRRSAWYGLKLGAFAGAVTSVSCTAILPINPFYIPLFFAAFACIGLIVGAVVGFLGQLIREYKRGSPSE